MFNLPKEIIILDLEITTWEGALARDWSGPNEHKEVIQIGAAKVETENFDILDTFDEFVKPTVNPKLSQYCIDLTHITQKQIDGAETFPAVLETFATWCGDLDLYCFGSMKDVPRFLDRDTFVENAKLLGIKLPFPPERFHNINLIFHEHGYDVRQSGSAPKAFGLKPDQTTHNALNDVKGLVQGLKALRKVVLSKE